MIDVHAITLERKVQLEWRNRHFSTPNISGVASFSSDMAFSSNSWSITCFLVILQLLSSGSLYADGCYTSIFSFGDSLADTGNLKQLASISDQVFSLLLPPYGENFFDQSTGRCSNGRLIIDFLAESLGLPLLPPFLHDKDNVVTWGHGVNYAVAGATALNSSILEARGIVNSMTNASLGVQLEWFKQTLPSLCNSVSECRNLIASSLIIMGEIGGNDYNYPILAGKPINEVEPLVPLVIDTIISAINELIDMGAQTLVVPGNFPIGCSSAYLTLCGSENKIDYDNTTGCLINLNKFAEYHNELLQTKLNHLRELHPNVVIMYADYYNAAMQIFLSPDKYGFTNGALKACCGGGGPYNVNATMECGVSASVCDDPDTYVNWDGIHLTESAYRVISRSLFQGAYTTPQFNSLCPAPTSTSTLQVGNGLWNSV